MKKVLVVVMAGLFAWPAVGCRTDRLETGYVPHRLGSTEAQRRGRYARPFTREAAEAGEERIDRRPTDASVGGGLSR